MPSEVRQNSEFPEFDKSLWEVTWPLLLSFALSLSLHFADSFFLSRISDSAAAAGGALLPVLGMTVVLFAAIGQAGASVAAQLLGARRLADVPATYLALVLFDLVAGVTASAVLFALHPYLPYWLGLSGAAARHAESYLAILGGFQFLKALQTGYGNVLSSRGETRWVLAEALVTNVTNIVLNLVFLNGWLGAPRLGVQGVAVSTVTALAVGLLFSMAVVHFKLRVRFPVRIRRAELVARLRPILRIGLPSAAEPVSYQCSQLIVNAIVITFGAAALAARTYVFNLLVVTTMLWSLAFGIATQILVAHRVGAQRFDAAHAELTRALAFTLGGNLLITLGLWLFHPALIGVFTDNPAILRLAAPLFAIAVVVELGRAVNIVAGGALRSSGDARYVSSVGVSMMWGIAVPCSYVFAVWLEMGLSGIWLAMALDEVSRGVVNYRRWKKGHWKSQGVAFASERPRIEAT